MARPPERLSFEPGEPIPAHVRLKLPEELRPRLGAPFGPVMTADEVARWADPAAPAAAIGDVCARDAAARMGNLHFIVVDLKTRRGPVAPDDALRSWGDRRVEVASPAEFVTAQLYNAVLDAAHSPRRTCVVVEGEEDLAVLPAIMHMPPGATVIYGMPNRGATAVRVDDESRRLARGFLEAFAVENTEGAP
jgi:uncharacterized protein (UPF0218 family)